MGSIPGQGTKTLSASQRDQKVEKKRKFVRPRLISQTVKHNKNKVFFWKNLKELFGQLNILVMDGMRVCVQSCPQHPGQ